MPVLQLMGDHSSYFENIKRASVDDENTPSGKAVKKHLFFFFCTFYYSLASMFPTVILITMVLFVIVLPFDLNRTYCTWKTRQIFFPFPVMQPLWCVTRKSHCVMVQSQFKYWFDQRALPLFSVLFINTEHGSGL